MKPLNQCYFFRFMPYFHSMHRHIGRRWALIGLICLVLFSACEIQAPPEVTPVFVEKDTALVAVTGRIAPAVWSTVGPQISGMVAEVLVAEGDKVTAGTVLIRLDDTDARLAVQQAEAALNTAKTQLARTKVGRFPEDIAVAEAQVVVAQTTISQTLAQRNQLWAGNAEADIAAAEAAVAAAQTEQLIARRRHEETLKCYDVPQADGSTQKTCPLLGNAEEQARFVLQAADKALAAAEVQLKAITTNLQAQRRIAEANVAVAEAQYQVALAQLARLKVGVLPEDIAIAEAAVAQAQVALEAAKIAVTRTVITAPFAGTVTRVDVRPGQFVIPGQPLITLGDLSTLRVETTDLDEIDVARIAIGQAVTLTFDALPDLVLGGTIKHIALMAESSTGGVNYTVIIAPAELPPQIRWGMTVFVDIDVHPAAD